MPLTAFIFDAKRFSSTAPILAAERLSAISAAPLLLHLDFSVRPVITCVIAVYISFSAFRLFVLSLLISLHNLRTCFSTCLFANQQGHRLFCSSARTSSLFCSPASTSRLDTIHCGFCFLSQLRFIASMESTWREGRSGDYATDCFSRSRFKNKTLSTADVCHDYGVHIRVVDRVRMVL